MNKIWLIIKREYLSRVRNKTFILSTFLFPVLMIGFIAATTYISIKSIELSKVAVNDKSGLFEGQFKNSGVVEYDYRKDIDEKNYASKGFSGVLIIPALKSDFKDTIRLISDKQLGIAAEESIRKEINRSIENKMLLDKGIQRAVLDSIRESASDALFSFQAYQLKGSEVKQSNSGVAYGIGFFSGILIYITLLVYGASVMRGVMEEKMNRIAEVMVSSVKPFQLMLGKIIGIAAVGLTQFLLWIVLLLILSSVMGLLLPADTLRQAQEVNQNMPNMAQNNSMALKILEVKSTLATVNWPLVIGCFLFYFLGGYLFYSSLFAAVGSLVNEDPQDAQALTLPITMPIILSFLVMVNSISNPNSSLSVWASIIPFSSPIVMMARIPFGVPGTVPWWQLGLSMVLLIAGFLFTTWLSAKIYRTGILLYGKKVTWKEISKWVFKSA